MPPAVAGDARPQQLQADAPSQLRGQRSLRLPFATHVADLTVPFPLVSPLITAAPGATVDPPSSAPGWPTRIRATLREALHELRDRPPGQVSVLDALRSLAVLLVVLDHSYVWWREAGGTDSWLHRLPFVHFGWTGVDLFFILSGYLIGRQLWREYQRTRTVDVTQFVLRRGFRIWPLYFVFAIGTPLFTSADLAWSDWLFVSNYVGGAVRGGWSLSTEEQFYIVLPLAVAVLARFATLRGWIVGLLASLAAVELARYLTATALLETGLTAQAVKNAMYSPGHLHCEGLLIGALIALLEVRRPTLLTPVRSMRGAWGAIGVALAGIVAAGVLRTAAPVVAPYLSLALIYGGLTVALLLLRETRLVRILQLDRILFYRISRLSYGVYLNHFFVAKWVMSLAVPLVTAVTASPILGFGASVLLAVAASLTCAAAMFVLIEHPFLQARGVVLNARRAKQRPAEAMADRSDVLARAVMPSTLDRAAATRE